MQILNVVLTERQHAWPYCFTSNCVWCRAAWPRQNFTIVNKQQLPSLVTWHSAHVTSHRHSCPIRRPQARMVVQDKDKHNKASPLVQIPETSYVVSKVLWIKCACKFVKEIESLPDATIIYPGTLLAHSPSCTHTQSNQIHHKEETAISMSHHSPWLFIQVLQCDVTNNRAGSA